MRQRVWPISIDIPSECAIRQLVWTEQQTHLHIILPTSFVFGNDKSVSTNGNPTFSFIIQKFVNRMLSSFIRLENLNKERYVIIRYRYELAFDDWLPKFVTDKGSILKQSTIFILFDIKRVLLKYFVITICHGLSENVRVTWTSWGQGTWIISISFNKSSIHNRFCIRLLIE